MQNSEPEVRRGPYLSWLWSIRERFGEEVWDQWMDSPAPEVDSMLQALVVPYKDSTFAAEAAAARAKGRAAVEFDTDSLRRYMEEQPAPIREAARATPNPRRRTVG